MPATGSLSAARLVNLAQCAYTVDAEPNKPTARRQTQALVELYLGCKGPDVDLAGKRAKVMQCAQQADIAAFMESALTSPWARCLAVRAVQAAYRRPPEHAEAKPVPAERMRHLLRSGWPFSPAVTACWKAITGENVRADGLLCAYASLVGAWNWLPIEAHVEPDGSVFYNVEARDSADCSKVRIERVLRRKAPDDGLELFDRQTWIDAHCGIPQLSKKIEQIECHVLRSLCDHPRTRIVTVAGRGFAGDGWRAARAQHNADMAGRGYLCATWFKALSGGVSAAKRVFTVTELINAAKAWLTTNRHNFVRESGGKPIDTAHYNALLADLQDFENPFELLQWQHTDVTYRGGADERPCPLLGKIFFAAAAPPWFGVRFVWDAQAWERHVVADPSPKGLRVLRLGSMQYAKALQKLMASEMVSPP